MLLLRLLAACGNADTPLDTHAPDDAPDDTADTGPDTAADTAPDDTGEGLPAFDVEVDVLVVGSGPAGLAAAIQAQDAGATVLVFERDEDVGIGVRLGGRAFAVGTRWQEAAGVADSVDAARAEWEEITGVSGDNAGVVDFLETSAATLEWVEAHGATLDPIVTGEPDAGTVARLHGLTWPEDPTPGDVLAAHLTTPVRTQVEVTEPVLEDGAIVGVRWRDLVTGAEGATGARAVVIATGGFLRDRAEVAEVAPALAEREYLLETNYGSDGGGLGFLDAAGAGSLLPENIGVYVHSVQDPAWPEGESLVVLGADAGLLVDEAGARFADENLTRSFDLYSELPEGEVFAVLAGGMVDRLLLTRPYYNWSNPPEVEWFTLEELVGMGSAEVWEATTPEELAAMAGIDPAGLAATIEEYNLRLASGEEDPFGRDLATASPLSGEPWVALHLLPGLAKNFGGVATDERGRVLDRSGVPIPGLYAGGEVAGMVLAGGGGDGFSGSVTACYRGGLIAGEEAAAFAR